MLRLRKVKLGLCELLILSSVNLPFLEFIQHSDFIRILGTGFSQDARHTWEVLTEILTEILTQQTSHKKRGLGEAT